MDVKTYRVRSLQEALQRIRADLGPDASVLHTRRLGGGLWRRALGASQLEVTASTNVDLPSRLPKEDDAQEEAAQSPPIDDHQPLHQHLFSPEFPDFQNLANDALPPAPADPLAAHPFDYRNKFRRDQLQQPRPIASAAGQSAWELSDGSFQVLCDLIEAGIHEQLARELIDRLQGSHGSCDDLRQMKSQLADEIESDIQIGGPIRVSPGRRQMVALVGPTGVGKTTTIAKLAANFRLRDKCRVGLITVDTYRMAAIEQLRAYADIIDLPMEVVSTPREMRQAVACLSDYDLVLIDTAGRSPGDKVRIQELRSMLAEAQADEVHLVLSCVASSQSMMETADCFADVGATAMMLTKLDESKSLGNLLPLLRNCELPLSYATHGQSVPDDIQPADAASLARRIVGLES